MNENDGFTLSTLLPNIPIPIGPVVEAIENAGFSSATFVRGILADVSYNARISLCSTPKFFGDVVFSCVDFVELATSDDPFVIDASTENTFFAVAYDFESNVNGCSAFTALF